jgi:NAD(P)-dependent dehydrogenase (short-subunit alcohol dehydrogenase family)
VDACIDERAKPREITMASEGTVRTLEGTVSVVAGGSSGIGAAVVERLAEHGSTVEFVSIDSEGVASLEQRLRAAGYDVRGSVVDTSDEQQVRVFLQGVAERHGRIAVLVNSVGIQRYGTVESTSSETWDEVFAVNVKSMFLTAKYAVPLLRSNGGGAIVNVSSVQAFSSQQNVVAYTASKGAIISMTRAMSTDYAREGIRVNTVCPASVDTPMLRASAREVAPDDPDQIIEEWGSMHPLGRVARPGEIADAILYLASPCSSFVTGTELRVDGGMLAGTALVAPQGASDAV